VEYSTLLYLQRAIAWVLDHEYLTATIYRKSRVKFLRTAHHLRIRRHYVFEKSFVRFCEAVAYIDIDMQPTNIPAVSNGQAESRAAVDIHSDTVHSLHTIGIDKKQYMSTSCIDRGWPWESYGYNHAYNCLARLLCCHSANHTAGQPNRCTVTRARRTDGAQIPLVWQASIGHTSPDIAPLARTGRGGRTAARPRYSQN